MSNDRVVVYEIREETIKNKKPESDVIGAGGGCGEEKNHLVEISECCVATRAQTGPTQRIKRKYLCTYV